jgi:SNF2 family DNA or RNA helicase
LTGKTIEAIGIYNAIPSIRRVLIVCPGFMKPYWAREFKKWCTRKIDIVYIKNGKSEFPHDGVVIINYELLRKFSLPLRTVEWDLMIVDEAHKLMNSKSTRTREIFGGTHRQIVGTNRTSSVRVSAIPAKRRVFLTGTPSKNGKPKEMWNMIQQLDPDGLGNNWFAFATRYCQLLELKKPDPTTGEMKRFGWKWDGADNLEELQEIMRERFMIRRLKSEVMKDLPEKQRLIIPIEPSGKVKKLLTEELRLFDECGIRGDSLNPYLVMPEFGEFSQKMHETGLAMVEPSVEVIESEMEQNDKIVVMCYHRDVAFQIYTHFLRNAALITGDNPPLNRQKIVDDFARCPEIKVLVCTMMACGEGLDGMQAAQLMIFPERSWVPGDVQQAEDRIHRRGQAGSAVYKHLVMEGSLAQRQVTILLDKQAKNDVLLDTIGEAAAGRPTQLAPKGGDHNR